MNKNVFPLWRMSKEYVSISALVAKLCFWHCSTKLYFQVYVLSKTLLAVNHNWRFLDCKSDYEFFYILQLLKGERVLNELFMSERTVTNKHIRDYYQNLLWKYRLIASKVPINYTIAKRLFHKLHPFALNEITYIISSMWAY